MHVAFVVKILGPRGGTEEYVRAVGEALLARGHELSFLYEEVSAEVGPAWSRLWEPGARTCLAGDGRERGRTVSRHLSAHRPDVLFVHGASFGSEMFRAAAESVAVMGFAHDFRSVCLRVSKVFPLSRRNCTQALGYSCLLHGCSIGPPRGGIGPISWNGMRRKLAERDVSRQFDRVIVASRFMRDLLLRNGFLEERVSVNPLFCPSAVPDEPPELAAEGRLLYIGQLQRFKGLSLLLQAMRHLPASLTLDVAGDGPWRGRFEALTAKWKLQDRVRYHGWVEREELATILDWSTIVVVPSVWNEPFGLVGLQAMAHARPVVAFDVGGVSEWLEDDVTGVLVREMAAEPLARTIAELSADRARAARYGACGYRRLRERFTLDRHLEQLVAELTLPMATSWATVP